MIKNLVNTVLAMVLYYIGMIVGAERMSENLGLMIFLIIIVLMDIVSEVTK